MKNRLGHQDGFAVIGAISLLMVVTLFVLAMFTRALATPSTAQRDLDSRRAMFAAEAGMRTAIYRANMLDLDLDKLLTPNGGAPLQQCLIKPNEKLGLVKLTGNSWCPGPNTEEIGAGASFDYRLAPVKIVPNPADVATATNLVVQKSTRRIVATGTSGRVTRRIAVDVKSSGSTRSLPQACLLGGLLCIGGIKKGEVGLVANKKKGKHDITEGELAFVECPPKTFDQLPANSPDSGCPIQGG